MGPTWAGEIGLVDLYREADLRRFLQPFCWGDTGILKESARYTRSEPFF